MGKAVGGNPGASPLTGARGGSGARRGGGPPDAASEGEGPEAIGAYLARQRQLRGIGLDELAERTRIPRRSLERLEAGAFDARPDGFARGFVRTVAVAIGLDPDQTVTRMLAEPVPRPGRAVPALRRAVVVLIALALALGAVLGVRMALRTLGEGGSAAASERPVRRDAVRALAVSRGVFPAGAEQRAQPLRPVPMPTLPPPAVPAPADVGPGMLPPAALPSPPAE